MVSGTALLLAGRFFYNNEMTQQRVRKVFDQLVQYYRPTRAADTFGQVKETFAFYQKAFCAIERYVGGEDVRSERVENTGAFAFLGHYIPGIDTTYRILYEGDYYAIIDIEPIERKRWIRLRVDKIAE